MAVTVDGKDEDDGMPDQVESGTGVAGWCRAVEVEIEVVAVVVDEENVHFPGKAGDQAGEEG